MFDNAMDSLLLLFFAVVLIAAVLANIAIWSHRKTSLRVIAVLLTALFIPVTYVGITDVLSRPKPMTHEWFKRNVDEARVLGLDLVQGRAIYLWLRLDGDVEPTFYKLPWQPLLAERLENLVDEGLRGDKPVRILNPFSKKSYDDLGSMNMGIIEPPSLPLKAPPQETESFDPRTDSI